MLEAIATVFSIAGAILMASNTKYSKYAYLVWPVASTSWMAVAISNSMKGLMLTYALYMCLEFTGMYKWLIRDKFFLTKPQK